MLKYVRNIVAHHSRFWNKNLIDQPKLAPKGVMKNFDPLIGNTHMVSRAYIVLCILAHFIQHVCPNSSWQKRVCDLVDDFPTTPIVNIKDMGFPSDWQKQLFWRIST